MIALRQGQGVGADVLRDQRTVAVVNEYEVVVLRGTLHLRQGVGDGILVRAADRHYAVKLVYAVRLRVGLDDLIAPTRPSTI